MKQNRAVLTAVAVIVVLALGWWMLRRRGPAETVDLVDRFETATKKPDANAFSVTDAALNNETKHSIAVQPVVGSRLIYKVLVPDNGWLNVAVGMKPESWTTAGNGVKFHVGVSDGRAYESLFEQHVNPFANQGDRKWIPVWVDLSAYAGEEIDLIFNTNSSTPNEPPDERGDMPLWGAPQIVVR
jgi:hypothetical protein